LAKESPGFEFRLFNTSDTINSQLICSKHLLPSKEDSGKQNDNQIQNLQTSQSIILQNRSSHSPAEKSAIQSPIQEFLDSDCGTSSSEGSQCSKTSKSSKSSKICSESESQSDSESDLPFEQNIEDQGAKKNKIPFVNNSEEKSRVPKGTPLSTALNMAHLPSEIASINELGDRIDSISKLPKLERQASGLTKDSEKIERLRSSSDLESPKSNYEETIWLMKQRKHSCCIY
jgi:hypothetical protein